MKIIGHRGFRGAYPENTLIAFTEAIKIGVHAIEFDVVMSGDGKIVVSHEPFMSRITCLKPNGEELTLFEDQQYNLYKMPYDEIKAFDCGQKGNIKFLNQKSIPTYKPLLSETIEVCEANAASLKSSLDYIIEIKSSFEDYENFYSKPERYVKTILKTLDAYSINNRIVLKSFDVAVLNEIKRQRPSQKISLLINRKESIEDQLVQLNFTPEILGPYFKLLTNDSVKSYKNKGFLIYPWTVNKISNLETVIALGVDGIITDYPNRLMRLIQ